MTYFKSRTRREQILIVFMLALILVFAIWQFAINPVLSAKADALDMQARAQRDLSIVQTGLPKLTQARNSVNANAAAFNRTSVIDTARAANIAISRVQPQSDNALKVWFEDAPSQNVYSFLTRLSQNYNVTITRVNINRRDGGVVTAQVTLVPVT